MKAFIDKHLTRVGFDSFPKSVFDEDSSNRARTKTVKLTNGNRIIPLPSHIGYSHKSLHILPVTLYKTPEEVLALCDSLKAK